MKQHLRSPERRIGASIALWLLFTAIGCIAIHACASIDEAPMPDARAQAWTIEALEAAARGESVPAAPESARSYDPEGAIVVLAWREGRVAMRYEGDGSLAEVVGTAARDLPAMRPLRFTVTVVRGEGPVVQGIPFLSNLALVPALEGLHVRVGDDHIHLTPDELTADGAYERGVQTPIPELAFGVDLEALIDRLARELGHSLEDVDTRGAVTRFRAGRIAASPYPSEVQPTEEALRAAASDGARFLLRHQRSDGTYTYLYDARSGGPRAEEYNLPRHSGATYFLAQAARYLDMPEARQGALRALAWLERTRVRHCGGEEILCVEGEGRVEVGSAALAAIAAAEVLATGDDPRARRLLVGLAAFLRSLQREDGELMHEYDLEAQRPIDVQHLYYSGEAALALLKAHEVLGDERDITAARRLMAHLTGAGWDFLGSRYFYGEEHWTCISAGQASDRMELPAALDFCRRWAEYNRVLQYREGETPWASSGAYGAGTLFVPRLTPVASRTEANISTYEMSRRAGIEDPELRAQIERSLGMLLRHRWNPGPAHLFGDPDGALGGIPGSPLDLTVRNDFVQHACSAMARWADLLRREREGTAMRGRSAWPRDRAAHAAR